MAKKEVGNILEYKVLKPIEYFDQEGNPKGLLEVGSIQKVPEIVGKKWVEDGSAELVLEKPEPKPIVKKVNLKNVFGKEVEESDYFYSKDGKGAAPIYFNKVCGNPVDREDIIEVFNKVFKIEDNFLLYKTSDKEVYIIIVPLKYSTTVNAENESADGDFQKHAISFVNEGSVNLDTLKLKLKRIIPFVKYTDR